ncbi:hypothetical protein KOR42_04310 [Thalassoglobus neptunius]|uniref:Uncharacterized protein n=1 Tax=Thalassoglobus neptunius TaxID=1938619 RepID=A0A5C5X4B8_9PLAN|nr:hypothetical protein KOR42_04310 [Thalassoglobus neptunius]
MLCEITIFRFFRRIRSVEKIRNACRVLKTYVSAFENVKHREETTDSVSGSVPSNETVFNRK